MHMLYNSENFAVMQHMGDGHPHGGFEIVDKTSRREIYLAASFSTYCTLPSSKSM